MNGGLEMETAIQDKSFHFAIRIVNLCKYLQQEQKEYILAKQLMRSGTSIGANVAEAQQAQSKPDFVHKMNIALKEAAETEKEKLQEGTLGELLQAFHTENLQMYNDKDIKPYIFRKVQYLTKKNPIHRDRVWRIKLLLHGSLHRGSGTEAGPRRPYRRRYCPESQEAGCLPACCPS